MSGYRVSVEGIGFWASGLPGWEAACAFLQTGARPESPPRKPSPELLAPNERRRAPDTVALAIEVAQKACRAAGRDPATLSSVFTSTHGDLAITDYMCATLTSEPLTVSPTKFHNSVHNAAAGYWTIGAGCMAPATAISAYSASFAQGLIEAIGQLAAGEPHVLLVAYDALSPGPLRNVSCSEDFLAGALLLSTAPSDTASALQVSLEPGSVDEADGRLSRLLSKNAMAPMLPLFEMLADGSQRQCLLRAGPAQRLRIERCA